MLCSKWKHFRVQCSFKWVPCHLLGFCLCQLALPKSLSLVLSQFWLYWDFKSSHLFFFSCEVHTGHPWDLLTLQLRLKMGNSQPLTGCWLCNCYCGALTTLPNVWETERMGWSEMLRKGHANGLPDRWESTIHNLKDPHFCSNLKQWIFWFVSLKAAYDLRSESFKPLVFPSFFLFESYHYY